MGGWSHPSIEVMPSRPESIDDQSDEASDVNDAELRPGDPTSLGKKPPFHGLGVGPMIPFEDESNAPPVDEEKLRKLEWGQLSEKERDTVLRLTATYASWWHACRRIIQEEEARYRET